jgi:hypothetical protein
LAATRPEGPPPREGRSVGVQEGWGIEGEIPTMQTVRLIGPGGDAGGEGGTSIFLLVKYLRLMERERCRERI